MSCEKRRCVSNIAVFVICLSFVLCGMKQRLSSEYRSYFSFSATPRIKCR